MSICPHCKISSNFDGSVRWSSRGYPLVCKHCAGLSHVLESTRTGIPSLSFVLALAGLLTALTTGLWPLGITGLAMAVAYNNWAWARVELFPIPGEASAMARRVNRGTNIAVVIAMFISW